MKVRNSIWVVNEKNSGCLGDIKTTKQSADPTEPAEPYPGFRPYGPRVPPGLLLNELYGLFCLTSRLTRKVP